MNELIFNVTDRVIQRGIQWTVYILQSKKLQYVDFKKRRNKKWNEYF